MPSLDQLILQSAQEGGLDGAFSGTNPKQASAAPSSGFFKNVYDYATVQPFYQAMGTLMEASHPVEDGFDPLASEAIKGFEDYAMTLREARSSAHLEAMKARITALRDTKTRLDDEGSFLSELAAEVVNPFNYLPGGALRRGVGFGAGFARGAAGFAPAVAVEETLRARIDPTVTRAESAMNLMTGTVLGGLIGGGVGVVGGVSGIRRLAQGYESFMQRVDGDAPAPRVELEPGAPGYVARPTEAPTGVASAFGAEKLTSRFTPFNRLVSRGVGAVEDFANSMAGEFDVLFNRNKVGLPTESSAFLRAGQWRGLAADVLKDVDRIYNEYLGGGARPAEIANINLPVMGQRLGQAVGMRPSDGLLTYREFMDAVFRSHTRNGIRSADPHVKRAAERVRTFFDKARDDGVETGFLSNSRFSAKAKARYQDRVSDFGAQIAALEAKTGRSAQDEAKLVVLRRSFDNARSKLARYAPPSARPLPPPVPPADPERRTMVADNDEGLPRAPDPAPVQRMGNTVLQQFTAGDIRFDPANDGKVMVDAWTDRMSADATSAIKPQDVARAFDAIRTGSPFEIPAFERDQFADVFWFQTMESGLQSAVRRLGDGKLTFAEFEEAFESTLNRAENAVDRVNAPKDVVEAVLARSGQYRQMLNDLQYLADLKLSEYETGKAFVADVFHGTKAVFDRMDPNKLGQNTEAESARKAFFSARLPGTANAFEYAGDPFRLLDENDLFVGPFAQLDALGYLEEIDGSPDFLKPFADSLFAAKSNFDEAAAPLFKSMRDGGPLSDKARSYFENEDSDWGAYLKLQKDLESGALSSADKDDPILGPILKAYENLVAVSDTIGDVDLPKPNVQMLRVRMDDPLVYDFKGERYREISYNALIERAKAEGRDGVVMLNTFDGGPKDVIYAAFSPDQYRARADAEAFRAKTAATEAMQGRSFAMPTPANDAGRAASRADLRGADGFNERPRLDGANDDVPDYGGPANDPFYLPRLWDSEAIRTDEEGPRRLRAILTQWYKDNPLPGTASNDAAVAGRVDTTIRNLLEQGDHGELQIGAPTGGSMRLARDIDIPNELVADFVETDVGSLIRTYAGRAGIGIEVARKFGTRDAEDAIDDMLLRVIDEATGTTDQILKLVDDVRADAIDLRDFTLGDQYSKNPASWSRKTAQALTAWATLTQMGGAVFSALTEVAKPVLVHGVQRTLSFALNALSDPQKFGKAADELRLLTGEGVEVTMGSVMRNYIDNGGPGAPMISKAGRALDRATRPFVNFANGPYYNVNLLGPFTDALTTYGLVMANHFMIEDILKVAKGQGGAKLVERLASYGLSAEDAARIAAQPFEKMTKLYLPNVAQWNDGDLVARFGAAVAAESRRLVVKTGPANKPNITQGFVGRGDERREYALLRLPFQYMNFGFAAINKNLLSALQGRDANVFAGTAALIGMGYLASYLKSPGDRWQDTPMEERILRAVNLSGILGLYGDIPNMVENATRGQYGLRPTLGLPPAYGFGQFDEYSLPGQVGGPGGGKVVDLYKLFVDGDTTAREQAKIARRMIPLNDLFYWKSIFKNAERGMTDALM